MSGGEGELHKRLWTLTDEKLQCKEGIEINGFIIEDVENGIERVLAEAKQDFPWNLDEKGEYDNAVGDVVVLDWFERWFGKAGADVGKAQTKKD